MKCFCQWHKNGVHHKWLRWYFVGISYLNLPETLFDTNKDFTQLPNNRKYKYCEPISQQYISTRKSQEIWLLFISKDFTLMVNQFDGNEALNHEFFHDSTLYDFMPIVWLLGFRCSQNWLAFRQNAAWHVVSLSMLDPLLDISHMVTGWQRLHDMGH